MPTATELRTAIEVLAQLDERVSSETIHSIIQLPPTQLGVHYAKNLEGQATERTARIKAVSAQLANWRDELATQQQAYADLPARAKMPDFAALMKIIWFRTKSMAVGKMIPKTSC